MPVAVFCMFLHRMKSISNRVQTPRNLLEIFMDQNTTMGQSSTWGCPKGGTTHQGAPRWVVPTSVASRTAPSLCKYSNIPETLGESTKFYSSHCKYQTHEIQSRALFRHSAGGEHDDGGVHHPHWCLSDDACVVHLQPSGP